jgi:hypothetical protein
LPQLSSTETLAPGVIEPVCAANGVPARSPAHAPNPPAGPPGEDDREPDPHEDQRPERPRTSGEVVRDQAFAHAEHHPAGGHEEESEPDEPAIDAHPSALLSWAIPPGAPRGRPAERRRRHGRRDARQRYRTVLASAEPDRVPRPERPPADPSASHVPRHPIRRTRCA